jgi:Right handed beta helix region
MKTFIRSLLLSFFLVFILFSANGEALATTRRVPADHPTIQAAINASANGDTVLIAPGTYTENINFAGKAIRVTSEGGPQVTIIDGNQIATVVTFNSGEGLSSELSGLTLQNGAPRFGIGNGGGVNIQNSSPTITNNIVVNNSASEGGGIRVGGGSPIISNNRITNNTTGGFGGGIFAGGSSPIIRENLITENTAGFGGGIAMLGTSSAQILNNSIVSNTAQFGGGIELFASGPVTIRSNLISRNEAQGGGGIEMVNDSPAVIVQNLIVKNRASSSGGGISWGNQPGAVINNTIADNDAPDGSGIFGGFSIGAIFINNIVVAKAGQVAFSGFSSNSIPTVFKSNNVFSPQGAAYGVNLPDQTGMNGNISADPLFADALNDNYHLLPGSPSIDAGDNAAPNLPATDFDGDPRILDGNGDGLAIVDQGVDEVVAQGPSFDTCIQDDSNGNLLKINSSTGDYQFTNCAGFTLSGTGSLVKKGSIATLQHNDSGRRVLARIDSSVNKATASIQVFSQSITFTITDRNTTNNTCACP